MLDARAGTVIFVAVFTILVAAFISGCGGRAPTLVVEPAERAPAVVVKNVAVLDVVAGRTLPGRDVVVEGDRIARIVPHGDLGDFGDSSGSDRSVGSGGSGSFRSSGGSAGSGDSRSSGSSRRSADTLVLDGRGATLLPGLIDMHAHPGTNPAPSGGLPAPAANLRAYLYCGVTTVVDLGGLPSRAFERRSAVAEGTMPGPILYAVGPIVTVTGGHPVPVLRMLVPWWLRWYAIPRYTRQVDAPEQARAAAQEVAGIGADFLKVVVDRIPADAPRLDDDTLAAAVEAAAEHGLRTIAHIGTTDDALDAARAGVAAWGHVVYRERIPDTRIGELAAFAIPMIPTLTVFEAMASRGQGTWTPTVLERETVAPEVLASFDDPAPDDFFDSSAERLRAQRDHWYDNVWRLYEQGVTMLAGSDMQTGVFPGPGLHREIHNLARAGLGNLEALRAATLEPARFLSESDDPPFGVVAEGKRADLLLVDGDPLEDLAALERIRAVIVRGVPIERTAAGAD